MRGASPAVLDQQVPRPLDVKLECGTRGADADRRADYDELGVIRQPDEAEDLDASPGQSELKKATWRATLAVIPGAAAGTLTLVLTGEPLIAAVVAAAPVLAAASSRSTAAARAALSSNGWPLILMRGRPYFTGFQVTKLNLNVR